MTYTPADLRRRAERERLISPNQRGESAEMLEWAADRIEQLSKFALWALAGYGGDNEPGDIDGGDLQDHAEKIGLLTATEVTEPCSENCACAEYYGDFPMTCYRLADWLMEKSE